MQFFLAFKEKKYLVSYDVIIEKKEDELVVTKEKLACSTYENDKWHAKTSLIEYNINEKEFFKPAYRLKELTSKDKEAFLNLNVAKELSKKVATSFIFSRDVEDIIEKSLGVGHDTTVIIKCLKHFAMMNLYIVTNKHSGVVSMSHLLPFTIRLEDEERVVSANFPVRLFETFVVPDKIYDILTKALDQINTVLENIIPGLTLEAFEHEIGRASCRERVYGRV